MTDDFHGPTDDNDDLLDRLSMNNEDADDIDFDPAPASLGLKAPEL